MSNRKSLYRLEWSPDGITTHETFYPEGKPFSFIKWKISELRRTTHKTGTLVPIKINQSINQPNK